MSTLTDFSIVEPTNSGFLNQMYVRMRALKVATKERLELDHAFSGTLDTADVNCDGYHKQITMAPYHGFDSETGYPILDPENKEDANIFYTKEIDDFPELFCNGEIISEDGSSEYGLFQITNKGRTAFTIENNSHPIEYLTEPLFAKNADGSVILSGKFRSAQVYKSLDYGKTWSLMLTASYGLINLFFINNYFFICAGQTSDAGYGGTLYWSKDSISWTSRSDPYAVMDVCWNGQLFCYSSSVSGSYSGYIDNIYSSTDLSSWTLRYSDSSTKNYLGLSSASGCFFYFTSIGYKYSFDTITWQATSFSTPTIMSKVFELKGNLYIVIYSSSVNKLYKMSIGGITLIGQSATNKYVNNYMVKTENCLFFSKGTSLIYTKNGITWSEIFISNVKDVVQLNNIFYIVSYDSYISTIYETDLVSDPMKIYSSGADISYLFKTSEISFLHSENTYAYKLKKFIKFIKSE